MTERRQALVLIPALNEERSVGAVVERTIAAGHAVLVISDGSRDRTAEVARTSGADVVELPVNLGVGGALRCGFRWAIKHGFTTVVQVDADGQHNPEQVARLLDKLDGADAQMVVGSRFVDSAGAYSVSRPRKAAMQMLSHRVRRRTGLDVADTTSGFRAITQPLLGVFAEAYPAEYLGDTVEALAIAGATGATVVECPVDMSARAHGLGSASRFASLWYIVRVMIALEFLGREDRRIVAANEPRQV